MDPQKEMAEAVAAVIPSGWTLVPYEPAETERLPDKQTVYLKIRSVGRAPEAPLGAFAVNWVLTLMTQQTSRQTADPQLSKDLLEFLLALDDLDPKFAVIDASEKTVGSDLERLAYDITVRMHISK